jgi:hypothetical protein
VDFGFKLLDSGIGNYPKCPKLPFSPDGSGILFLPPLGKKRYSGQQEEAIIDGRKIWAPIKQKNR